MKTMIRYQFSRSWLAVAGWFGFRILAFLRDLSDSYRMSGSFWFSQDEMSGSTALAALLLGLLLFLESFPMALQNGVSRRRVLASSLAVLVPLCFAAAVGDELITVLAQYAGRWSSGANLLAKTYHPDWSPWLLHPVSVVYSTVLILLGALGGYFLTAVAYTGSWLRVGLVLLAARLLPLIRPHVAAGRVLAGAWLWLVEILPVLVEEFLQASPFHAMGLYAAAAVVLALAAWLTVRKMPLKK